MTTSETPAKTLKVCMCPFPACPRGKITTTYCDDCGEFVCPAHALIVLPAGDHSPEAHWTLPPGLSGAAYVARRWIDRAWGAVVAVLGEAAVAHVFRWSFWAVLAAVLLPGGWAALALYGTYRRLRYPR